MPIFFKLILIFQIGTFAYLQYDLWYGDDSVSIVRKTHAELEQHLTENTEKFVRNRQVIEQIDNIKLGENALELKARMDLGMIMPGEVFYVLSSEPDESFGR